MDSTNRTTKHGEPPGRASLFFRLRQPGTVMLESSRQDPLNTKQFLFHTPIEILTASSLDEIPELFRRIEHYRSLGYWSAGYAAYECGYHFDTIIPSYSHSGPLPLAWFGIYAAPELVDGGVIESVTADAAAAVQDPVLSISEAEYRSAVDRLKEYIVNGDTYQVNFTDRFEFTCAAEPSELYFSLRRRQHVPFSAFLNPGDSQLLSFSPELFFRRNGNTITAKPMKGTAKRGRNAEEDRELSAWLQKDEKNRSENLMIVDLLRNDIGRICNAGSVEVSDMFSVERYDTVLQMTSTVTGTLKPELPYYEIFKALFPCGSVTGAPKIRTMQIINEAERHPRGAYCGAIGYIAPGDESVFSVAIRTIALTGTQGVMGVGSGIVYDSVPEKEYEECRWKAAFLLNDRPDFHLLETMRWNGTYTFLVQHLDRMKSSAEYFHIPFDGTKIADVLAAAERTFRRDKEYRVRLLVSRSGIPTAESSEYSLSLSSVVRIAPDRTRSADLFLCHKTTNRPLYNRYREAAVKEHLSDYLFMNERHEITEGSVSNIFIEKDGALFTPPLLSGVLPGTYRAEVLRTNPNAAEKIITLDDVRHADALYLCNSVMGWSKVTLSE